MTNSARSLVPLVFAVHAVLPRDISLGFEVGQQRKAQLSVVRECDVTPHAVDRNADQLGVESRKLWKDFVVEPHLIAADRTPVRRIEREDYRPAAKFAERHLLIGRRRKGKVRRLSSGARAGMLCSYVHYNDPV